MVKIAAHEVSVHIKTMTFVPTEDEFGFIPNLSRNILPGKLRLYLPFEE